MCVGAGTIATAGFVVADVATAEPARSRSVFLAERSSEAQSRVIAIAADTMTTTTDIANRATIDHASTTSHARCIVSAAIAADAVVPTRAGAITATVRIRPDRIPL